MKKLLALFCLAFLLQGCGMMSSAYDTIVDYASLDWLLGDDEDNVEMPDDGPELQADDYLEANREKAAPAAPVARQAATTPSSPADDPKPRHIANIYFANGETELDENDRKVLRQVAGFFHSEGRKLRIVGHASVSGENEGSMEASLINFQVSLDRAQAVALELARNRVPKGDIIVEARGDADPMLGSDAVPAGPAYDRRAEIYILY